MVDWKWSENGVTLKLKLQIRERRKKHVVDWRPIDEWMEILGYEWVKPTQVVYGGLSWTEAVALLSEWAREGIVRKRL